MDKLEIWTLIVTPLLPEQYPFALPKFDPGHIGAGAATKNGPNGQNNSSPFKKSVSEKSTSFAMEASKISLAVSSQLYRVTNLPEVSIELEHHLTKLKMVVFSSTLRHLQTKGESLLDTLSQLTEIVQMLTECQTKVL